MESLFDMIRAQGEKAREAARNFTGPLQLSAAALVEHGPAAFAETFDKLFAYDNHWKTKERYVLLLLHDRARLMREAPTQWKEALHFSADGRHHSAIEPDQGGWVDERAPLWIASRFPHLVDVIGPYDVRVVAYVDGKLHPFVRIDGVWRREEEIRAMHAAVAKAEADRVAAELAAALERDRPAREAAAKVYADRERVRKANLERLARDPETVIALATKLGLVAEDGTLRNAEKGSHK